MTARLQARIPKCFSYQLHPGFDYYIWVDASCSVLHPEAVSWFVRKCESHDIALFLHPDRRTIKAEYEFIRDKITDGNKYLSRRYAGEFLDDQYLHIASDHFYTDDTLYASTAFVYRNTFAVQCMLEQWWVHISRYHIVDQLALPYVVAKSRIKVNRMPESYLKIPYLTYTRNQPAQPARTYAENH